MKKRKKTKRQKPAITEETVKNAKIWYKIRFEEEHAFTRDGQLRVLREPGHWHQFKPTPVLVLKVGPSGDRIQLLTDECHWRSEHKGWHTTWTKIQQKSCLYIPAENLRTGLQETLLEIYEKKIAQLQQYREEVYGELFSEEEKGNARAWEAYLCRYLQKTYNTVPTNMESCL
jgi:hypothetical protein